MGIISLEKANHLFWLGRYIERVFFSIKAFSGYYDAMLDIDAVGYKKYCQALDIPDIYESKEDFVKRYIEDINDPNSIAANLQRAYDNAVVLRDEIGSETLSYIQMAVNSLSQTNKMKSPLLEMTTIIDDIFAFWGSVDDNTLNEEGRNIMKCGKYIERLDLNIRLEADVEAIERSYSKLMNRIKRVHIGINEASLNQLAVNMAEDNNYNGAIGNINSIFIF